MARNITNWCRLPKLPVDKATALTSREQRILLKAQNGNTGVYCALVPSYIERAWCNTCTGNMQVCSLYASTMATVLKSS